MPPKGKRTLQQNKESSNKNSQVKYERLDSYQLGVWATGQEQSVTPVFLPVSTGRLDNLDKQEIARLLPCPAEHLEMVISPFSILFGSEHHIVCAYDAGPNGLSNPRGPEPGIAFSEAPGDLCCHAVHMTRSIVTSFGSQLNGNAIFFYLKRGKHFLAQTDFRAVQAFIEAWDEGDAICTNKALKRFAKVFHTTLNAAEEKRKSSEDRLGGTRLEAFDVGIFPALDEKPFITKQSFAHIPPEEFFESSYHSLTSREDILGDGITEFVTVGRTPKHGDLGNKLLIYMRSFLHPDGGFCPPNLSVQRTTNRTAMFPWSGNFLVVRQRAHGSELCEDITPEDLDIAITYFYSYGRM